ncbi:hypothetical protein AAF712_005030 [Marasmius tenuissimus]|uniref:SAM-dependent MTase RsmB/NOP-type domain-containing protein n=1 Tax=Marasmius tenuissimus TaxID=585030 RepID=A0ABR3A1N3_9AGAR
MNFYFSAAQVLDRLDAKQGSIKGLIATLPEKDRKRTSALVIETLKYKATLNDVIQEAKLLKEERKKLNSANLALVLVHDLLLSNGGIQAGDGPIKQAVLRHKTRLKAELQKLKIKRGVGSNTELAHLGDARASQIPRYVRVNTLLWSMEEAVDYFVARGYMQSGPFDEESNKGFAKDEHITNLLLFNPKVSFQDDPCYQMGKIILQDKASCFPAAVLNPPATLDAAVIDATAAPGNKTSHLSALMQNKGKVVSSLPKLPICAKSAACIQLFAFEKDKRRFSTLEMMLGKAKCKNIKAVNADFLATDPQDPELSKVTHILLDPSCSGSGIVNRLDYLLEQGPYPSLRESFHSSPYTPPEQESESEQEARLHKLASFQLMMINHAMKFPNVKRIVYSTCSIHAVENEHVVSEALKSDEATAGNFKLAPANQVLPQWPRRGLPEEMGDLTLAKCVVRCMPGDDKTNGFFVSCFIRDSEKRLDDTRKRKHDDEFEPEDGKFPDGVRKKKRKKKKKSSQVSGAGSELV